MGTGFPRPKVLADAIRERKAEYKTMSCLLSSCLVIDSNRNTNVEAATVSAIWHISVDLKPLS